MIGLLIFAIVVCIVAGAVIYIIGLAPISAPWSNAVKALVALVALLVILQRLLPALGPL